MTQTELNRAVARATGERVDTIASLGFGPLTTVLADDEPLTMDWDEVEARRQIYHPIG